MANDNMKYLAVVGVVVVFIVGLGAGALIFSNNSSSSEPYHLTLVITSNNTFNSTVGSQPAFFVLQNGVLSSSAKINVPVNKKIELTIMNYDSGADTVNQTSIGQVITGTTNNTMFVVQDDVMNASQGKNGIQLNDNAQYISSVPLNDLSHTFTVVDGSTHIINIPIEPSSTTTTIIQFSKTGTFNWQCLIPCGSDLPGAPGWGGAMNTPGWMAGSVVVS